MKISKQLYLMPLKRLFEIRAEITNRLYREPDKYKPAFNAVQHAIESKVI